MDEKISNRIDAGQDYSGLTVFPDTTRLIIIFNLHTAGFLGWGFLSFPDRGSLLTVVRWSRLKSKCPLELTAEDIASWGEHFSLAEIPSNRSFPASVRSSMLISMVDVFICSCD